MNKINTTFTATIMFADIAAFTQLVGESTPLAVAEFLNNHYKEIGDIIFKNNGEIIKYIGDCALVVFNGVNENKNHEESAIKTAIAISKECSTNIFMSINTGDIHLCKLGHPQNQFTDIIGEAVNVASRQDSLRKNYDMKDSRIIISESTYQKTKDNYNFRLLGEAAAKGLKTKLISYTIDSA